MSKRSEAARPPLPPRHRRRWAVAIGVVACWLFLLYQTGSMIAATMLLALLAGLGVVTTAACRALGLTRDHPWLQRMAARPWRDGQDVLQLALRHLPEVFVVTPSGSLLAPDLVELRMNPADLSSLGERMEPALIDASAAEVYEEQVAARGASLAGRGPAEVRVMADSSVPQGRYRLRQGQPVDAGGRPWFHSPHLGAPDGPGIPDAPVTPVAPGGPGDHGYLGYAADHPGNHAAHPYPGFVGHDGDTRAQPEPGKPAAASMPTVIELIRDPVPVLRLVTGDSVAQTRTSGARAGRGAVELALPNVPTVSREHARFTFSDGRWRIANLGRNGVTLNDAALVGEQPLGNGDSIRWGMRPDALLSRVEIG